MRGGRVSVMLRHWARLYGQTPSERAFEPAVAALGERYRSQHPFWALKLFADFALLDRNLVIEVDGDSHNKPSQIKKDLEHSIALQALGWRVVRVTNEDAVRNPAETVARALVEASRPPPDYQAQLDALRAARPELFVAKQPRTPKRRRSRKQVRGPRAARPRSASQASQA